MRPEIVERRLDDDSAIDFQQRLLDLVLFLYISVVHFLHLEFRCDESGGELLVLHEAVTAVVAYV